MIETRPDILLVPMWVKTTFKGYQQMALWERETNVKHKRKLTVCIRVDSALETRTNTSASTQNLSIHRSKLGVTSIPGLKHEKIKNDIIH